MTTDVCDTCWGSGDRYRTWANLRRLRGEMDADVAKQSLEALANSCGANYGICAPNVDEIVQCLEKFANKRGLHYQTATLAEGLAEHLKLAIGRAKTNR